MSTWTESKITRDLSERDSIEPPEGLLEKLKADIPSDLGSRVPAVVHREAEVVPMHRRRRWLLAASVILTVTGGLLATMVVMRQMQPAEEAVEEAVQDETAAAGAPEPAAPPVSQEAQPQDVLERSREEAEADAPAAPPAAAPEAKQEELRTLGYLGGDSAPQRAQALEDLRQDAGSDKEKKDVMFRGGAPRVEPEEPALFDEAHEPVATPPPPVAEVAPEPTPPPPPPPPPPPKEVAVEGGVEGGVAGGVVGGVPGGVFGGVPGGVPSGAVGTVGRREAPASAALRVGGNEAPSEAMMFKSTGAHPFVDTAKDRLSTFGLDVDTASYTVARRYLREGQLPPPAAIRVEEFVNYFSYGDPPPTRGDFALKAEGAASIFTQEPHTYLVRFNLRAREVKAEHRKPAVLTFVVDVSGSMDQGNRLGLVKQSLGLLLDQLRKDDKVGLVVYGSEARVLLEPTSDRTMIRQAIEQLVPTGATNAEAGIALGYDVAGRSFRPGAINRILLCSDGVANVGATGPEQILGRIQREAKRGIELTTLGFGMGNFNDALMEQLADKGNGRYAYLDDLGEARRVFVEELTGTLQTIAEDAKAQVEFFPAAVTRWRLIGYENRDIPDEKFRDNTVDAGEIGAGHSVTALYEVQLRPEAVRSGGKIASLHLRYRVPVTGALQETVKDLKASELVADWKDASPGFRLASLVVEFAETLRGTSYAGDLHKIERRVQRVVGEMDGKARSADVAEFARLVEEAARIKQP